MIRLLPDNSIHFVENIEVINSTHAELGSTALMRNLAESFDYKFADCNEDLLIFDGKNINGLDILSDLSNEPARLQLFATVILDELRAEIESKAIEKQERASALEVSIQAQNDAAELRFTNAVAAEVTRQLAL